MFEGFANVWTPVALSRELGKAPLAVRVAGEPLVLFRDRAGQVAALVDRCPHRGVKLSLGKVAEDGTLACGFHGWCFDREGACARVPLNPELDAERRARLAASAIPVHEAGGLVWVFTGARAGAPPEVPDALVEDGWSRWYVHQDWSCHWTRAMENMLDMPHVPFVHRRTIGRALRRRIKPDSAMRIALEETASGFSIRSEVDGTPSGGWLEWRRPNGMILWLARGAPPATGFRQHVYCVPLDATTTRMFVISTRTFLRRNPLGWLSDQFNRAILLEDKAIVESSQPREAPHPSDEVSVATDAATLRFRRWYQRELAPRDAGPLVPAARLAERAASAE